jgi:hypothetical protein
MPLTVSPSLDLPTLSLVAVCIAGLLGVFLIIDFQQRNVRALAWWGSAYLIGASAMALASMPTPIITLPAVIPGALTFLACGMIWNGVRLFQGRRVLPLATFTSVRPFGWGSVKFRECWITAMARFSAL